MTGDLGLQAERTELAWERTAFAAFATGALLASRLPGHPAPPDLVPAGAALLLALAMTVAGALRRRGLTAGDPPGTNRPGAAPVAVYAAGLGTAALGVLVAVLALG